MSNSASYTSGHHPRSFSSGGQRLAIVLRGGVAKDGKAKRVRALLTRNAAAQSRQAMERQIGQLPGLRIGGLGVHLGFSQKKPVRRGRNLARLEAGSELFLRVKRLEPGGSQHFLKLAGLWKRKMWSEWAALSAAVM